MLRNVDSFVDNCDVVVRMNQYATNIGSGTKTDIWLVRPNFVKDRQIPDSVYKVIILGFWNPFNDDRVEMLKLRKNDPLMQEIGFTHEKNPTAGMVAIAYFLRLYSTLYLVGYGKAQESRHGHSVRTGRFKALMKNDNNGRHAYNYERKLINSMADRLRRVA